MLLKNSKGLLLWLVLSFALGGLSRADELIYNSHGKKDPFAPPEINDQGQGGAEVLSGIKVEGIIWEKDNPLAVVNSKVVMVGETVAGVLVAEIKEDEVIFEINGRRFPVKLHNRVERY